MNINKVEIGGGLIRDVEVKFLQSGIAVAEFTIATNGARYDSKERQQIVTTQFTTIEAWGWLAEEVAEMALLKGEEVYVIGELDQRERTKDDGTKERKTKVRASIVKATRRKPKGWSGVQQAPQAAPAADDPWASPPAQGTPGGAYDEPPF